MSRFLLTFVIVVSIPVQLVAQDIHGRVVDRVHGAPIHSVTVSLIDSTGEIVARVLTGADGVFEIRGTRTGLYSLAFRRIGYHPSNVELQLTSGARVSISEDASALQAVPIDLEEVVVSGARDPRLERTGFYERRVDGHGSFITREEFEVTHPSRTTDVLRRLRGIRVRANGNYGAGDARRYIVETSRGAVTFGGGCSTQFFVDGLHIGSSADRLVDLDAVITIHDIAAIEVYSGAGQIPAKYNIMGGVCGIVLLWTQ